MVFHSARFLEQPTIEGEQLEANRKFKTAINYKSWSHIVQWYIDVQDIAIDNGTPHSSYSDRIQLNYQ